LTVQASWCRQAVQMPLPMNAITWSLVPQKMQVPSSFFNTMLEPSIEMDS
jgi:hypothetical protein